MSYCRCGENSDVYAYQGGGGYLTYVDGDKFVDATLQDFLARLLSLREQGHAVPQFTINRIKHEIQHGDESPSYGDYLSAYAEAYSLCSKELTPDSTAKLDELRGIIDGYLKAVDAMS